MLQTLLSLLVPPLVSALAFQVPLEHWHNQGHTATLSDGDPTEWSLHRLPSPNDTDHLVFETASSLLQHWPNTRMRNGHNIVPGIVPKGTLLYHGRPDGELPAGPEWTSTDPEHSYLFSRSFFDSTAQGGWHLTLMATRPLKVLYFDGSSAVKFPFGSMDTQDLMTTGKPSKGDDLWADEFQRVNTICEWGKDFGIDGIMRMEMDFEIIICNFTAGLNVVSFDHVPSKWTGPSAFSSSEMYEVLHSGAWHNHFPGETRVHLDLPGMVSFYDTQLAPSLIPIRVGQERWDHRAINVSSSDLSAVISTLETNLRRPTDASSGVDWQSLFRVIVDRYADRLELMRYFLRLPTTDAADAIDLAKKAQTQLRIMLTPYVHFSDTPTDPSDEDQLDWAEPILKRCATTHTRSMESLFESMTGSEKLFLRAVRGTSREICRAVTKMWAGGVHAGIDASLNTNPSPDIFNVARLHDAWTEELDHLMTWLDWNVWVKCDPGCGVEETCYLPTWPIGFPWLANVTPPQTFPSDDVVPDQGLTNLAREVHDMVQPAPDEWIRPQPKCIRRFYPHRF